MFSRNLSGSQQKMKPELEVVARHGNRCKLLTIQYLCLVAVIRPVRGMEGKCALEEQIELHFIQKV